MNNVTFVTYVMINFVDHGHDHGIRRELVEQEVAILILPPLHQAPAPEPNQSGERWHTSINGTAKQDFASSIQVGTVNPASQSSSPYSIQVSFQ